MKIWAGGLGGGGGEIQTVEYTPMKVECSDSRGRVSGDGSALLLQTHQNLHIAAT
jgi:hypothetical protein